MGRLLRRASAIGLLAGGAAGLGWALLVHGLPDPSPLADGNPGETRYMRRPGASGPVGGAAWVRLDSISPLLACAVVKAEDRGYFAHRGVEWGQVARAAQGLVGRAPRMGGSTISQQLARNLYLGPERTPARKLREAVLARRMERTLGKRRILEIYLNVVEWGDGTWGAEAASRRYFVQPARDADPFQAVFLASLLAAPRAPLAGANGRRAHRVQLRAAAQLYLAGLIDEAQWRQVVARSGALRRALDGGATLHEALGVASTAPGLRLLPAPPRAGGAPVPPNDAIGSGCGLQRELQSERLTGRKDSQ